MDLFVIIADMAADVRPVAPIRLRFIERLFRVDRRGRRLMRREPGQHERGPLSWFGGETGHGGEILAVDLRRSTEAERVRSGDREAVAAVDAMHPRDDPA